MKNTAAPSHPATRAQSQSPTAFEALGGEAGVRALVDRFYDLMDLDPAYAALRAVHAPSLDSARDKLTWYLCGWTGGPPRYTDRFGHPRLRARHLPYAIGVPERDQWLACMTQALQDCGVATPVRDALLGALKPLADWMRNQAEPCAGD